MPTNKYINLPDDEANLSTEWVQPKKPIRIRFRGDYAAFNRPEMSVERYSYDVMTPSAARGMIEAVYFHPGLRWHIRRIYVERPIRFANVRRNEVSKKILASDVYAAARGADKPIFIDRREAIQQRAATVLRDVSYVVEANFTLVPEKMNATDSEEKFYAIFCNRARRGRCFTQPYFGCREFPASFELVTEDSIPPQPISESRDLGIMLYDMDYSDPLNIRPSFFHAEMLNGVVEVDGKEVLR
mgnify:CR=1 FL=1